MRDSIFISYSHADRAAVAELQGVLATFGPDLRVGIWDDTRITPASRWKDEIDEALSTAAAAVLLLSPSFFASAFIREFELPALLSAARTGQLQIFAVVLFNCEHQSVTATFQAINDPGRPLDTVDEATRRGVWQRLALALTGVVARIDDETRIGAEGTRLERDTAAVSAIMAVNDKIARAKVDPAFDEHESMRENTLVFLEGERCQALATWLIEESKRTDLDPGRSKAIVRMLEHVARRQEVAMKRATELTRQFAGETMAMLNQAKKGTSSGG